MSRSSRKVIVCVLLALAFASLKPEGLGMAAPGDAPILSPERAAAKVEQTLEKEVPKTIAGTSVERAATEGVERITHDVEAVRVSFEPPGLTSSISSVRRSSPAASVTSHRSQEDRAGATETANGTPIFYRPSARPPGETGGGTRAGGGRVCGDLRNVSGNSRVVFPLPYEHLNSYEDTWGAPRVQGGHEGTDLMVPSGTPEYAITDGTLVRVAGSNKNGWNSLGGYAVMLRADHAIGPVRKGDLFYYAHMKEESALPIGSRVEAGQVLGYAGDTGQGPEVTSGLFPPHLHFGWYDASGTRTNLPSGAMNPYPLLEWLKGNGGTVTGGSSARYCEAPQSKQPLPATGTNRWPAPANASPAKSPDLDTGTRDARPSPVAKRVARRVEERSAIRQQRREKRQSETTRAGEAGRADKPVARNPVVRSPVVRSPVVRSPVVRSPVNRDRLRGGSAGEMIRDRARDGKGREESLPKIIREAGDKAEHALDEKENWRKRLEDRVRRGRSGDGVAEKGGDRDRPSRDRPSRDGEKNAKDPAERRDEPGEDSEGEAPVRDRPDTTAPDNPGDGKPVRDDPCGAASGEEPCAGEPEDEPAPAPSDSALEPATGPEDPATKEEAPPADEEAAVPANPSPDSGDDESSVEISGEPASEPAASGSGEGLPVEEEDAPAEP